MARRPAAAAQLDFGLIVTDPEAARIEAARKTRKCLSCGHGFASEGPGNRICKPCKGLEVFHSAPDSFALHTASTASRAPF
ncbi:hypothetical protein JL101_036465 (plasmid) [Skermanella rosea]|uniref:hypothetical protein n=1 Tax=Skermanella rosea TaxID=1817965 RepID=UPI00193168E7|nr:hypothetical protein [Skermanella rosea]UEM08238.1 hypothetical protein JL101_036465 [Skermanella rosea]